MLGFNWIDGIIILLLVLAVVEGARIGFFTQVFAIVGFFGSLFLTGWLFPHLLPVHNLAIKTIVSGGLVLLVSVYVGLRGSDLGQNIHWSFRLGKRINKRNLKLAENLLGILPSVLASLVLVWLLGVAFGRLPFAGFSNSVSDSRIVQTLSRTLPPVPTVFADLDKQINPNAQPFVATPPQFYHGFNYSVADAQSAEDKAANSVVRVTSFGCGGLISGSGFAVASDLVATDAHVIAGVKRPIIKYNGGSFEGIPIFFDDNLDLAILRVPKLNAQPLVLANGAVSLNSTVAVVGYPGGNYTAAPAIIRDNLQVSSTNIYDEGSFERTAYGVQASVEDGSSGGPVVLPNGQAAGIIFSRSTASPDYAYALSSSYISQALNKVKTSSQRVGTGACTAS